MDTHTGIFLAHVPQHEENPFTKDIQQTLNDGEVRPGGSGPAAATAAKSQQQLQHNRVEHLVSQLRFWITKQRVHKTLQQLPATSYEKLPVLFDRQRHPLKDLSQNRMHIRLHRHPDAVLIIEFHEKSSNHCEMEYKYYFLWVRPASIEDADAAGDADNPAMVAAPRVYLKALSMVQFDPFLVTHGCATKVDTLDLSERIIGKRKVGGKVDPPIKRTKFPAYFISDLAHVVAFADERIPFTNLAMALNKRGIAHSGVEIEDSMAAVGLTLRIVNFPTALSKSR